jgi:putative transposase
VQTLERVCREVGYPKMIRVDNGSEFISRDLNLWAYQREVVLDFSRPGKPPTMRISSPSTANSGPSA